LQIWVQRHDKTVSKAVLLAGQMLSCVPVIRNWLQVVHALPLVELVVEDDVEVELVVEDDPELAPDDEVAELADEVETPDELDVADVEPPPEVELEVEPPGPCPELCALVVGCPPLEPLAALPGDPHAHANVAATTRGGAKKRTKCMSSAYVSLCERRTVICHRGDVRTSFRGRPAGVRGGRRAPRLTR
jgi:hypothetical protein